MSSKTEKLSHIILELVTPVLLQYAKEQWEDFGVVSILEVKVSTDYSYADIAVSSTKNEHLLPKFFAGFASELRWIVWKQVNTRKIPLIRFKVLKHQAEINRVYDIFREIEEKYDLNA